MTALNASQCLLDVIMNQSLSIMMNWTSFKRRSCHINRHLAFQNTSRDLRPSITSKMLICQNYRLLVKRFLMSGLTPAFSRASMFTANSAFPSPPNTNRAAMISACRHLRRIIRLVDRERLTVVLYLLPRSYVINGIHSYRLIHVNVVGVLFCYKMPILNLHAVGYAKARCLANRCKLNLRSIYCNVRIQNVTDVLRLRIKLIRKYCNGSNVSLTLRVFNDTRSIICMIITLYHTPYQY